MAYVRTVKTSSGATAVGIVWSSRRGSHNIEHIGSAHDGAECEALAAAARQRLAAGQAELDLGLGGPGPHGPPEIASSRMGHSWDALSRAYDMPVPPPGHPRSEHRLRDNRRGRTRPADGACPRRQATRLVVAVRPALRDLRRLGSRGRRLNQQLRHGCHPGTASG